MRKDKILAYLTKSYAYSVLKTKFAISKPNYDFNSYITDTLIEFILLCINSNSNYNISDYTQNKYYKDHNDFIIEEYNNKFRDKQLISIEEILNEYNIFAS